jgi:hypothetical protein
VRVYASAAAVAGWALLVLLYVVDEHFQSLAHTITFFSYFSILSNILAALTLTAAALWPAARGQWLLRPAVAGAVTLYMCVTGLAFALHSPSDWQGWRAFALIGLHHVMPIVFLMFWIVVVAKGTLTLRAALLWLIFPVIYLSCLLLGEPCYGFLDAGVLGFDRVARNIGLMAVAFLALAQSLVLIDRVLGRARREAAAADRPGPQARMTPTTRYLRTTPSSR